MALREGPAINGCLRLTARPLTAIAYGVLSEAKLTAINAATDRPIASVPESTTMGVYNSVGALVESLRLLHWATQQP